MPCNVQSCMEWIQIKKNLHFYTHVSGKTNVRKSSRSCIPKLLITSFIKKCMIKLCWEQREKFDQKSTYTPGLIKWHKMAPHLGQRVNKVNLRSTKVCSKTELVFSTCNFYVECHFCSQGTVKPHLIYPFPYVSTRFEWSLLVAYESVSPSFRLLKTF